MTSKMDNEDPEDPNTSDDNMKDLTDDILWGDCTEEEYLRQILEERHGLSKKGGENGIDEDEDDDNGTFVDSIMGQSTVAEILSPGGGSGKISPYPASRNSSSHVPNGGVGTRAITSDDDDDEHSHLYGNDISINSKDRRQSWMRFAPMAGSMTTIEDGTVMTSVSLPMSFDDERLLTGNNMIQMDDTSHGDASSTGGAPSPPQRKIMKFEEEIESFRNIDQRLLQEGHNNPSPPAFPDGKVPKYVESDEDDDEDESTMGYCPQVPGATQAIYDRHYKDSLSHHLEDATVADSSHAGISTLTGDSLLRYGSSNATGANQLFQYDHPKWWIELEEAKRKKREELALQQSRHEATMRTPPTTNKKSSVDYKLGPGGQKIPLTLTQSLSQSQDLEQLRRNATWKEEDQGCCSKLFHVVAGNEKVFRRFVIASILMILLFASLAAYAIVEARTSSRPSSSTSSPDVNPPPTMAPIPNRTLPPIESTFKDPYTTIVTLIGEYSPASLQALLDSESSQYQALDWLTKDLLGKPLISDIHILQRWAMAVVFFSTGGDKWTNDTRWLSMEDSICDWYSTADFNSTSTASSSSCNGQGLLQRLELQDNKLKGYLPNEIRLFSESLEILDLSQNQLAGGIPESISELKNLTLLDLKSNNLIGTIPSTLCDHEDDERSVLFNFSVDCTDVTCSCCDC